MQYSKELVRRFQYNYLKKVAADKNSNPANLMQDPEYQHQLAMSSASDNFSAARGADYVQQTPETTSNEVVLPPLPDFMDPNNPAALMYSPEYHNSLQRMDDPSNNYANARGQGVIYKSNDTRTHDQKVAAYKKYRLKQLLKAYAPYVGGGAALGALLGGYIGYRNKQTLAGSLLGGLAGAGLGAGGKYLYEKYRNA